MSNGSLTCAINRIWELFAIEGATSDGIKEMSTLLYDLASQEDCDMHNIDKDIFRASGHADEIDE